MRRLVLSFLLLTLALAPVGMAAEKPQWAAPDANIVLVSLDACRARNMSLYGYERKTTPHLEKFASRAVVFQQAITPGSWTLPATMSIFTGLYPSVHGVINKYLLFGDKLLPSHLNPAIETFPQVLGRHGYKLAAFTGDAGVKSAFGYGRGFEVYLDDLRFGGMDHSIPPALTWLEKNKDQKFFLFLHGYDSHGQYDPPKGYTRKYAKDYKGALKGGKEEQGKFREDGLDVRRKGGPDKKPYIEMSAEDRAFHVGLYDEKIEDVDARLGGFIEQFEKMGLMDKTIFIVLADHGEEFHEHGYLDHGPTLYEELLRVPLLIHFPGQKERVDVKAQVSTLDALPTALDAVGVKTDKVSNGISLLPVLEGKSDGHTVYSETDYRHITHRRCIRTPEYKFILTLETGEKELYNLQKDPDEKENVATKEAKVAYEMEQKLYKWIEDTGQYPDVFTQLKEPFIMEY